MPIMWPEPFGLVIIEAMACGTPVIAFNRGSVPEIIENGVTGYIVDDDAGAIKAVSSLAHLSRKRVRAEFMARFAARRMAQDYLAIYRKLGRQLGEPQASLLEAAD
jgi:glycosyltransferase involved in cell wall biosynthesis